MRALIIFHSEMTDLLDIEALKAWTKYERPAHVQRWLDEHGIPYVLGKNGMPCTTLQAINDRLLGKGKVEDFR